MNPAELYRALVDASGLAEVNDAIARFEASYLEGVKWVPVGARQNNRGIIEVAADPGRSLVERVTNAIDAVLEAEHDSHDGRPECRSPREAASAWLNVPDAGLGSLTIRQRQRLADRVNVLVLAGDNRSARILEIRDHGTGLTPEQMPGTILSLNESNKMSKHYLAGAYGQGGSSTFAVSACTLIASRRNQNEPVGFTLVRFRDLPPEEYKVGHYVYLTFGGSVLLAELPNNDFARGTQVRHFGYDLTNYNNSRGPGSVYGLLNQVLFDPVMPIWLDNRVTNYRRTIIGSKNGLSGAAEEGDGTADVTHRMPMFYVSLGELGRVGIEYWVLPAPTATNKTPTAAYANPRKPIVLSLNGQNQAELSQLLIRKDAQLPYLAQRMICHVDCNSLTPSSLRSLFTSSREDARRGVLLDLIKQELVRILTSDDDLKRLNTEARERGHRERDEASVLEARRAVARLLRLQGLNVSDAVGNVVADVPAAPERPTHPRPAPVRPQPLELREPPTFIRIVWDEDRELTFYPEQRRYIRIETDAGSTYHNPDNAAQSRINIIVSDGEVAVRGSTPLRGGRMRAIFDCVPGARVGGAGNLRVELSAPGLPVLSDERPFTVVAAPPARSGRRQISLPPFDIRPLQPDTDEQKWIELGWPEDVVAIASSAEMEDGEMIVYYNAAFPKYLARYSAFERRDTAKANSFKSHYEIWLVVHSLLIQNEQQIQTPEADHDTAADDTSAERAEAIERAERVRMATLAAIFAAKEVQLADAGDQAEAE